VVVGTVVVVCGTVFVVGTVVVDVVGGGGGGTHAAATATSAAVPTVINPRTEVVRIALSPVAREPPGPVGASLRPLQCDC